MSKKSKEYSKKYRKEHPIKFRRSVKKAYAKNGIKYRATARRWRVQQRIDVLTTLGGKCVRCGFTDSRALQIDHVKGGGVQELKHKRSHGYYRRVMAHFRLGGKKYQLLCANCNWIKKAENNEGCLPTYTEKTEEDY